MTTFPLSPLDHYFYRHHPFNLDFEFEFLRPIDTNRLKEAFQAVLKQHPVFSCRLKRDQGHLALHTQEIQRVIIDEGGVLHHRVAHEHEESLIRVGLKDHGEGSLLSISFSHIIGDGASFGLFLGELAKAYRGQILAPSFQRVPLFRSLDEPSDQDLFSATGYTEKIPPFQEATENNSFWIDEKRVRSIRRNLGVSANAVLSAMIFCSLKKYLHGFQGKLILRSPVDLRSKVPDAKSFVGNLFKDAIFDFANRANTKDDFDEIARGYARAVEKVTLADFFCQQQSLQALIDKKGPEAPGQLGCPGLVTTNLSQFPFHKIDFGSGAPSNVRPISFAPYFASILREGKGFRINLILPKSIWAKKSTFSSSTSDSSSFLVNPEESCGK